MLLVEKMISVLVEANEDVTYPSPPTVEAETSQPASSMDSLGAKTVVR